jgi:hypothetical protein
MDVIRRTLKIDAARLTEMAAERGQDVGSCRGGGALLDSVVGPAAPDIAEDRRRLDEFLLGREAVPLADAKAWVARWIVMEELPRPLPDKIE